MWKIQLIVTLTLTFSRCTTQTNGFPLSLTSHRNAGSIPSRSHILTRILKPVKSTVYSNPIRSKKRIDGEENEESKTNEDAITQNTSQKINNLVLDITNSVQVKAISVYVLTLIGLAKMGKIGPYTDQLILHDLGVTFLVGVASVIFVKTITWLSTEGILQSRDSRKIIHSFSAPIFMMFWPLFSDAWGARFFAALITFFQGLRLYRAGTKSGGSEGNELASALSRSGKSEEALGGPFIYTIVLFMTIVLFWRDNLSGVIVLSTMAAGDGAADLVGRRLGKNNKWMFNKDKSIAGSLAFFIASALCSIGILWWFSFSGVVILSSSFLIIAEKFALISALCAMVELLPFGDDNWSVPISAAVLSTILL